MFEALVCSLSRFQQARRTLIVGRSETHLSFYASASGRHWRKNGDEGRGVRVDESFAVIKVDPDFSTLPMFATRADEVFVCVCVCSTSTHEVSVGSLDLASIGLRGVIWAISRADVFKGSMNRRLQRTGSSPVCAACWATAACKIPQLISLSSVSGTLVGRIITGAHSNFTQARGQINLSMSRVPAKVDLP